MPKLCQPTALEDLALKASVKYLRVVGEQIMDILQDSTQIEMHLDEYIGMLNLLFDINVPCYLFDKLKTEVFREISALEKDIKKSVDMKAYPTKFITKMRVAVQLAEVVMSRHLRVLHFCTGLIILDMGSMSGGWKTEEVEHYYINGLNTMTNLRSVTLAYDCTDRILDMLAMTAPHIQHIDVSNSKYITDVSVDRLLRFKNLQSVQLHRTSITLEGYANLLLYGEELTDIGKYDEIGRVLEYIDEWYPHKKTFKLKKFITTYATSRHLQILCEKCPDIDTVSIFHNVMLIDLMLLIGINKLSTLKFLSCDFFADRIKDILEVKGCNLTHLHLEHVDQIDHNALMYISQYCPDLKTLSFYNCQLLDSTSVYIRKPSIPPFMNLERLTFAAQGSQKHLDFLLRNALKIKYISLGTQAPTCDQLFNNILSTNPLQYLEEMRIIHSDQLTITTAYKLVNNCPNLKYLKELEGWAMVKECELEGFKKYIKLRNLDLDITPWRKIEE
uniref:CSON014088 protein n=1 Tax=Culicoides sonorensis TaxID=179676 RepID=A0A336MLX6_CULSO